MLLLRAIELTGDPALGIAMGEAWSQTMLQLIGQLIVSCRTMREALSLFERYHALLGNNATWRLEEQDETAWLYCDDLIAQPVAARVGIEAVLTLTYRIGRSFVAEGAKSAHEVWFRHAEPPYVRQYARVFDCPLGFSEASAFHRAFKRWSGQTPAQFMKDEPSESSRPPAPNPSANPPGA